MKIELGCHKWTFPAATCLESARLVRALDFDYLDLGNGPDFDPRYIAEHPFEEAERFNGIKSETGVRFVDCFPQPGDILFGNNHPSGEVREFYRRTWKGFFPFAAAIGLSGVTLSPGRLWPGESTEAGFLRAAEELRWIAVEAARHELLLRIEPHVESVTWTPQLAVRMCNEVPGLSLTVDHSHFIFHGILYEDIAQMHPHGTHWHARQARPGETQTRFEDGEIRFDRIVADLNAQGYSGVISLEYVHAPWMFQDRLDCVTETIRLRDQLRGFLSQ